jgi:2-oxoglutarate/2-oxoacid ferredoxin oxidoreductase subunit alpha
MDYSIKIGGEAGQGIQTIGDSLAKVFARSGYHVFTHQDYESRVRGGHNFFQIRISEAPIGACRDEIDIVIALDRESIVRHERELSPGGIIVYDPSEIDLKREGPQFLGLPFKEVALQSGGSKVMANTVATGAVLGMLGMDLSVLFGVLQETLEKKGDAVIEANRKAAVAGRELAIAHCLSCSFTAPPVSAPRMLLSTTDAIGLGVLASGCKFYSAYPMTPSTGLMLFLAARAREYGLIVEQAEDEIAAINMALGASFAGVRAMTGTSGGGFALMVEGLSLAAMTETPIVILLAQRPGPATGLPTRTEQGDLLFAIHAGHGEFPRLLFAPGNPEQAFVLTNRAFDLSQKYQVPAFVLIDQYIADALWTPEGLNIDGMICNDYRLRGDDDGKVPYGRHAFTDTGISPFAIPGDSTRLVVTDSDEHDEEGHIVEDAPMRVRMVEKRLLKKLPLLKEEMLQPLLYGAQSPEIVLVGWGSMYGILREAVDRLRDRLSIAMLYFSEVFPLPPPKYLEVLHKARRTIAVEQNATGQFAWLLSAETGHRFTSTILRYDGRPYTVEPFLRELDGHL